MTATPILAGVHPSLSLGNGTQHLEVRTAIEVRAQGRRLEGYAGVFNVPARIGGFSETILPGAFAGTLAKRGDVLALVDHDPSRLLARTGSGTLRLTEDTRGLAFALDIPDTQLGRDILTLAERRDLGGMSFGFVALSDAWPAPDARELRSVHLVEISVMQAFPAYAATTVQARAKPPGEAPGAALRRAQRRWLETV